MTVRPLILATFLTVLIGSAIGGGTLLGRSLSASPATSPRLQITEGKFPMTFQGILLNEDGSPVSNSSHSLTFSIYNDPVVSAAMWSETQTVFTFEGLFTAQLGVDEDIDPLMFANNSETYIGVRVGFNPEMTPRIRMSYSPYALHAVTAENVITPPVNPLQVATLSWYEALKTLQTLPVGDAPTDIAFDGEHLWITNRGDDDEDDDDVVTKIRAVNGKKVADFPVGANPVAVAFDGEKIWVVNSGEDSLTSFRVDGTKRRLYPEKEISGVFNFDPLPLTRPVDLAFDGENMWVVNQGGDEVIKFPVSEGIVTIIGNSKPENFERIGVGNNPSAIAFDGEHMWVTHSGAKNLTKIRVSDNEIIQTISAGKGQRGIAFDGTSMWVIDEDEDEVIKVRASDGEVLGSFSVGRDPSAIAFDGRSIWVTNKASNKVTKLRIADGKVIGSFKVGLSPVSIAFDGINMWVVNKDDGNVMKK